MLADRSPVLGVGRNPFAPAVPDALLAAAAALGVRTRELDLPTLRTDDRAVTDRDGPVSVTALAPALLYWQEAAAVAYRALEAAGAGALNPVDAAETADDKARTAIRLAAAGVPQLPTEVVSPELDQVVAAAGRLGWPVVVKRTHGAQGRWVRRADDPAELRQVVAELVAEGRGALVVQPLVAEAAGRSLRVVCTGGRVQAATERTGAPGELRSNVSRGGSQRPTDLTDEEAALALAATAALGLGHAGVDLLRTGAGPRVLEVNACPDFTSMRPHTDVDLAAAVVRACLA